MRTCVVSDRVHDDHLKVWADTRYPGSHATVGRAGELIVMLEESISSPDGTYVRLVPKTVAIYAPGTWRAITYEEETT